jgi:hypothetical protein
MRGDVYCSGHVSLRAGGSLWTLLPEASCGMAVVWLQRWLFTSTHPPTQRPPPPTPQGRVMISGPYMWQRWDTAVALQDAGSAARAKFLMYESELTGPRRLWAMTREDRASMNCTHDAFCMVRCAAGAGL